MFVYIVVCVCDRDLLDFTGTNCCIILLRFILDFHGLSKLNLHTYTHTILSVDLDMFSWNWAPKILI